METSVAAGATAQPTFKTKAEREKEKEEDREQAKRAEAERVKQQEDERKAFEEAARREKDSKKAREAEKRQEERMRERERVEGIGETRQEVEVMKKAKLMGGDTLEKRAIVKPEKLALEGFRWDGKDDTTRQDLNPLYLSRVDVAATTRIDAFAPRKKKKGAAAAAAEASAPKLHWSDKARDQMTARDWRIFREDHKMTTRGGRVPHPARNWQETGLPVALLEAVRRAGYDKPSPIQMQAIPCALLGRDVIGIAETGSGKTAAFVLPMMVYISRRVLAPEAGPLALILAPVRELVLQIADEARKLGSGMGAKVVSIVGGESIEAQGALLREGCHVVVATPGRLKDCLERRFAVLQQCNYLVLDEADRMVDMGFEEDLKFILRSMQMEPRDVEDMQEEEEEDGEEEADLTRLPPLDDHRTTILYSATMPPSVERIARQYLQRPVSVTIGSAGKAVDRIEQRVLWLAPGARLARVLTDLKSCSPPAIVFCNMKKDCDTLLSHLRARGISATVLHSGKSQEQREGNLAGFRAGRYDVLVATNVAGRGIDIPGVTLVINYDAPASIEDYTHRIGRTGRAGSSGVAVTYISDADSVIFYDLKRFLDSSPKAVVPHELRNHPATRVKPGGPTDKHGKSVRGVE